MAAPVGEFIWYELMTTHAEGACKFYGEVVGWQAADSGMPNMDYRILSAGSVPVGGVLELSKEMLDGGVRPGWCGYVEVADVEATVDAVKAGGGSVHVPPSDIPDVGRFAMISDPQGVPIYVMHSTSPEESRAYDQAEIGHCAWNELSTPDPEAALDFYMPLFGWTRGETMAMGEAGDYQMFDAAGRSVGAVMKATPLGPPPMWRFYFRVASLTEASARIREGGGSVLHGPQQVPGDDEILIAADPQGVMLAVVAKRG
jgi:predicted enzyme related to lactoylglutathione lyase